MVVALQWQNRHFSQLLLFFPLSSCRRRPIEAFPTLRLLPDTTTLGHGRLNVIMSILRWRARLTDWRGAFGQRSDNCLNITTYCNHNYRPALPSRWFFVRLSLPRPEERRLKCHRPTPTTDAHRRDFTSGSRAAKFQHAPDRQSRRGICCSEIRNPISLFGLRTVGCCSIGPGL